MMILIVLSLLCSNNPSSTLLHDLSASLNDAYNGQGISGVLDLCRERKLTSIYEPKELVQAALQVPSKGAASGILNALIGSCCCCCGYDGDSNDRLSISNNADDGDMASNELGLVPASRKKVEKRNAQTALRILQAYDDAAASIDDVHQSDTMTSSVAPSRSSFALIPDVVTLALTYTASFRSYPRIANKVLSRAEYPNRVSMHRMEQGERSTDVTPNLEILLDSKDFMIINKPSGVVLTAEKKEPSRPKSKKRGRSKDPPCLEQILVEHCMTKNDISPILRLSSLNPDGSRGFVHRLDRGTSGCLVVAMTNQWHAQLLTQFFLRRVEKSYIALVYTNSIPLPRDHGTMNMSIDGRPAISSFEVLERYPGDLVTKIRVTTKQGRKHQVRIHCSKCLNAPILLDPLYGGESIMYRLFPKDNTTTASSSSCAKRYRARQRFCLHADSLSIPDLGIIIPTVEAPLPDWWDDLVKEIIHLQVV